MAKDVISELRSIQALLTVGPGGTGAAVAAQYADRPVLEDMTTDVESSSSGSASPRSYPTQSTGAQPAVMHELERQLAAARQQLTENQDKCQRLHEALQAAQNDGQLIAQRMQAQVLAKQEENTQLADLLFELREEAESLRQQLQCSTQQAAQQDKSTMASIAKLQQAAAEWRQQGDDALEMLAEAQGRHTSLKEEAQQLQQKAEELQRQLRDEQKQHQATAAELAALKTAVSSSSSNTVLVRELKQRLQTEKAWRKAVCKWLQGEMQTKNDLERVLINVGTAVRVGEEGSRSFRSPPIPSLPPRRVVASQLAARAAGQDGSRVTVTVHSPPAVVTVSSAAAAVDRPGTSVLSRGSDAGAADWRQHFKATMQAFDERHSRLQQELSTLRREALQAAT